jgi:hypothetical protein
MTTITTLHANIITHAGAPFVYNFEARFADGSRCLAGLCSHCGRYRRSCCHTRVAQAVIAAAAAKIAADGAIAAAAGQTGVLRLFTVEAWNEHLVRVASIPVDDPRFSTLRIPLAGLPGIASDAPVA